MTHDKGPILIIAGAGTGKTTVITRRIAWLISEKKALPEEILALTFTDKAAAEMEERVDALVPYGFFDSWISTFHAFGDRILRENALELGLPSDFRILTFPEQMIFLKEHLFELDLKILKPLSNPTRHMEALLKYFSRLKDEDISPKDFKDWASKQKTENRKQKSEIIQSGANDLGDSFLRQAQDELPLSDKERDKYLEIANAYQKYEKLMMKNGFLDFGDQIRLALKLFREKPHVLKKYQDKFRYILVDEYQDTNYAQNELIKTLVPGEGNITVVGDDDQCLPGSSLVETVSGQKKIKDIKEGEKVLTAIGKGHVGVSQVSKVFKKKKNARLITFTLRSGEKVTVTSNHKMFCFVPNHNSGKIFYVYLMESSELGWRIGISNFIKARLRQERMADRIIAIRACDSLEEALYYESIYSLKFNIPTICFRDRVGNKNKTEWLVKIFNNIDTKKSAQKLANFLGIDLESHHYGLQGVVRGEKSRVKISLEMNYRNHRVKNIGDRVAINNKVSHQVSVETSDKKAIDALREQGYSLHKAKGGFKYRLLSADLSKVSKEALKIQQLIGGVLEYSFIVGTDSIQHRKALCMNASNVLKGMCLPVQKGNKILYKEIVEVSSETKELEVYDLEIDRTHNFIADGVVVHNSIYRFRGAAISNILDFKDHYKKAKTVVLNKNYRSTKEILDTSYKLIQFNNPDRLEVKSKISKKLGSEKKGPKVEHIFSDTLSSEADGVANTIVKKSKEGTAYKEMAILVRKNSQAEPFMHALNSLEVPYKFSGSYGLYSRPEIRIILSFINAITDSEDSLSLYHLITSEVYGVDTSDAIRLNSKAKRENKNLSEILRNTGTDIDERTIAKIKTINDDLKKFREDIKASTAGQMIYSFLKDTGYLSKLTKEASENANADLKIQNIAKFFERVMNFEYVSNDKGLMNFKNELDLLIEAGDDPATAEVDPDIDAVNIITVHKAKGLEYEIVFMINLANGDFPSRKRSEQLEIPTELIKERLPEGEFHIQEERRLFYVAMTRAKKELFLSFALDYGKTRMKKISPFVLEALDIPKIESAKKKIEKIELIKKFEKTAVPEAAKQFYNGGILNLNPHQIDDYISCPLKFKYIHILKIPVIKHHAVIYGSAIHNAIGEYFVRRINEMPVSLDEIIKIYENAWASEGFIHRQHEKERFEQGKIALKHFFETQEKENRLPSLIEEKFGFVVENGDLKVKVNGRYDAVYMFTDHSSQITEKEKERLSTVNREPRTEIRDFKTSDIDDKEKADDNAKKSRQLSIYALSYKEMNGAIPETLTLHYVDTGVIGESQRTEKDLKKTEVEIFQVAEGIVQNNFEAAPGFGECGRCAYKDICSFRESK